MLRRTLTAATLAMVLGLSACGGADEPAKQELTQPRAGQCIADEVADGNDVAPDMTTVVPCTTSHSYEIVATFPIPRELLAGKTDKAKLARRAELADVDNDKSPLRKKLRDAVFSKCPRRYLEATGLDALTVLGKSAETVDMTTRANVSGWTTLSSPELWLQGKTLGICSFRFRDGSETKGIPKLISARSTSARPVMASYLTKDFPISLRDCAEPGDKESIACDQPHTQEALFTMDMKAVYGKDFLSGSALSNLDADQHAKLRAACSDPYEQAGGTISENRPMAFRFRPGTPTTGSSFRMTCLLSTKDRAPDRAYSAF